MTASMGFAIPYMITCRPDTMAEVHATKVFAVLCGVKAGDLVSDVRAFMIAIRSPAYLPWWRDHLKLSREARRI
jgi:hypothetical protein